MALRVVVLASSMRKKNCIFDVLCFFENRRPFDLRPRNFSFGAHSENYIIILPVYLNKFFGRLDSACKLIGNPDLKMVRERKCNSRLNIDLRDKYFHGLISIKLY